MNTLFSVAALVHAVEGAAGTKSTTVSRPIIFHDLEVTERHKQSLNDVIQLLDGKLNAVKR